MLEWKVYAERWDTRKIGPYNVFGHWGFLEACRKNARKNAKDRAAFEEQLRRDLQYCYWSKCEWEIVLSSWPPNYRYEAEKIDVFDQVQLNWEKFADYVWAHAAELRRREKKANV